MWIVRKDTKRLQEYIQNQLEEDMMNDQISIKEWIDPFDPDDKNKKKGQRRHP